MIDLKLYAVDKTHQRNIGAQLPQQIGIYNVESAAQQSGERQPKPRQSGHRSGPYPGRLKQHHHRPRAHRLRPRSEHSSLQHPRLLRRRHHPDRRHRQPESALQSRAHRQRYPRFERHPDSRRRPPACHLPHRRALPHHYRQPTPAACRTNPSALSGITINGVSAASLLNAAVGTPVTIPQIQYEDLGLTLKATPRFRSPAPSKCTST